MRGVTFKISPHPEDGGSKVLRNVGILRRYYMASCLRRPRLEHGNIFKTI